MIHTKALHGFQVPGLNLSPVPMGSADLPTTYQNFVSQTSHVKYKAKCGGQLCGNGIPILLMQADTNLCTWCLRASHLHAYTSLKHQRGNIQLYEISVSIVCKQWHCIMLFYDTFWNFETFGESTWALTQPQFQSFKGAGCRTEHVEWTIFKNTYACIQRTGMTCDQSSSFPKMFLKFKQFCISIGLYASFFLERRALIFNAHQLMSPL